MTLDGYLFHRVLRRDLAEELGEYGWWAELQVEIPAHYLATLRQMADDNGVDVDDLIAAIAHERVVALVCPRCMQPWERHPHTTDGCWSDHPMDCPQPLPLRLCGSTP